MNERKSLLMERAIEQADEAIEQMETWFIAYGNDRLKEERDGLWDDCYTNYDKMSSVERSKKSLIIDVIDRVLDNRNKKYKERG